MLQKLAVFLLVILGNQPLFAADVFCSAGNVTCLFDAMLEANFNGEADTIFLDNGIYTGLVLPSVAGPFPLTIVGQDPEHTIIDASGLFFSGGFFIAPEGNLTLNELTVRGANQASGIRNLGTLNMSRVKVDSNFNFFFGGGISNSGTAHILNSTISNNFSIEFSGGGIHNPGFMTITNSTIVNNAGGGANTSGNGIQNSGTLKITNSTIARNSRPAEVRGGGIENLGTLEVTNSTITENRGTSGGGIANLGTAELRNTILAGNIGLTQGRSQVFDPGGPDCAGILTSLGNNLFGDLTDCDIDLQGTDLTGDPALADFTDNPSISGSGHYPLLTDSRAIDAGSPDVCPATDQLGNQRVGTCDIGAIEFQGGGTTLVSIDIRPRGEANRINPNSTKEIRVVILSEFGFDATTVDPNSVRFGATGTEAAPLDVVLRDFDRDRDTDMILRFEIQDTGIQCGHTSASLSGLTSTGLPFTGSNSITTVRCGRQR